MTDSAPLFIKDYDSKHKTENKKKLSWLATDIGHLKNHIDYPATTEQVLEACNNMSDLPKDDSNWIKTTLPEGTYKSPEEVVEALFKKV